MNNLLLVLTAVALFSSTAITVYVYGQPDPMEQLLGPQLSYPPAFTDPQDPTNWTKTCNNVANEAARHYVLPQDILACVPWFNSTMQEKFGISTP
jgi:hypothetical protein